MIKVAIVGTGPAGLAAASVFAARGFAATVIDEGGRPGGQIYRRARSGVALDIDSLLGAEAVGYRNFHATFDALRDRIDYRPLTLAWGVEDRTLYTARGNSADRIVFDALILATGATDRTLPIPGWTLPGVYTLGGAQVLLKEHGCLIGRRIAFCGSSPLLYLAARQCRAMGAEIVAVLDTTPFTGKLAAIPGLLWAPDTLVRGLGYMAELRRAGVPMYHGIDIRHFGGSSGVEAVHFRDRHGREIALECDAVAFGFGLKAETQLADLAGAEFRYDPVFRQWLPCTDSEGRCGSSVYVAGDGASIGGAQAAALTGTLAACAVLEDFQIEPVHVNRARARRQIARLQRFQRGLAHAFAWPAEIIRGLDESAVVCRCESVSAGELRAAVRAEFGPTEVNRLKAITRCGMGRCQGRFCGLAAAELIAHVRGVPLEIAGRLRTQPPVKPLSLAVSLAENAGAAAPGGTSAPT